jgi:hypothetical protein
MERIEMIEAAVRLAHEEIDGCSACNDAEYAELKELPENVAIKRLAKNFLDEAAQYNFGD